MLDSDSNTPQYDLDQHLRDALVNLRDSSNPDKGVVAAALVSPDHTVYAFSEEVGDKWVHAERTAVASFVRKYGPLTPEQLHKTWIVTSLSPCVEESSNRHGGSCTDLLLGNDPEYSRPVSRVYSGLIDPMQVDDSYDAGISQYKARNLDVTLTDNVQLQNSCKALFEYFSPENYGTVNREKFVQDSLAGI